MSAGPLGLYVHIPFCSVKCFYCDFTAFSGRKASTGRYLKALEIEARQRTQACHVSSCAPRFAPVSTLYVGGGTPSELSAEELDLLLSRLRSAFGPLESMLESTVEANPASLSSRKLEVLARHGIGRLSLGLETAEPELLRSIGRRHAVEDFLRSYRQARSAGFSLNVDLMYGLPGQSKAQVLSSLETVLRLEPDHLSLYGLQVEDRTLFSRKGVEEDEDLQREMFEACLDHLEVHGFEHYEISNFARPGRQSVHNRIYWRDGDYIGLGCGASGHIGGVRYCNLDRLDDYCGALERGESPVMERESLVGREKLGERIMLGLRLLEGMELTPEIRSAFAEELRYVQGQGWAEIVGGACADCGPRMRLTREGLFLANRVFQEFVPPFRSANPISL